MKRVDHGGALGRYVLPYRQLLDGHDPPIIFVKLQFLKILPLLEIDVLHFELCDQNVSKDYLVASSLVANCSLSAV